MSDGITDMMIAKESCKHENAYFFHENAPLYCPDCDSYVDGGEIIC